VLRLLSAGTNAFASRCCYEGIYRNRAISHRAYQEGDFCDQRPVITREVFAELRGLRLLFSDFTVGQTGLAGRPETRRSLCRGRLEGVD